MTDSSSPDYKELYLRSKARMERTREEIRQTEELIRKAQNTTLREFIQHSHNLLWRSLKSESLFRCTTGAIYPPTGKYCPIQLRPWLDCATRQRELYSSVCHYLEPIKEDAPQLFLSRHLLEEYQRRFSDKPISCGRNLRSYERFGVEDFVSDILKELCKIPTAQDEFQLGNGVRFHCHENSLEDDNGPNASPYSLSCIHRIDGTTDPLLTTIVYRPSHALSVESLLVSLRPMNFWQEVIESDITPTDGPKKLKHNAARRVMSVIAEQYHMMIQEGLEYSSLTNGFVDIQFWVPFDDPGTLYYSLGNPGDAASPGVPRTQIARTLCLFLMSCRSSCRDQAWRNSARAQLPVWRTSSDSVKSQIPKSELLQTSNFESTGSEHASPELVASEHPPSSSPSTQQSAPRTDTQARQGEQPRTHDAQFCTQKCLLGLQNGSALDPECPNVELHSGRHNDRHPINTDGLVNTVKAQLDEDLDHNCSLFSSCGAYGVPFKITCATYGYTIVGKGTTSQLWDDVSQEVEIYRVLQRVQGSAVPVFLGAIDLAKIYFVHDAGEIRHMLLMGWGGERVGDTTSEKNVQREISRSKNHGRKRKYALWVSFTRISDHRISYGMPSWDEP